MIGDDSVVSPPELPESAAKRITGLIVSNGTRISGVELSHILTGVHSSEDLR